MTFLSRPQRALNRESLSKLLVVSTVPITTGGSMLMNLFPHPSIKPPIVCINTFQDKDFTENYQWIYLNLN